jgi:replicative DNA helicase
MTEALKFEASDASKSIVEEMDKSMISNPAIDSPEEEHAEVNFDFEEDFESRIVALALRDGKLLKSCHHILKPEYFTSLVDKIIVGMALTHFEGYGSCLRDVAILKSVIAENVKEKRIREGEKSEVITRIKELFKSPVDNIDYVIDKVADFAKRQAIEAAMTKSIDFLDSGNFDKIEEAMVAAMKVGAKSESEAYDYFETIDARTKTRMKVLTGEIKANGLPIGVPQFDNLLKAKGFGRKELTILMAAAKRGKTMAIWDIGKRWALMGYNVLGITCEVSTEILSDRLDSNISGIPMSDMEKHIIDVKRKVQEKQAKAGLYKMHEYPSNTLRPDDVDKLVEDYRSQGIIFDAIVVDYLDIMAPNRWVTDTIANSKSIWLDMRAIAQKYDLAMLSATQTNRAGAGKATADDTDVAEDYNKIRIADLVLSLNATDDELNRGEMRIFFAASRNQKGKFSVVIQNNMECLQFMTKVLEIN